MPEQIPIVGQPFKIGQWCVTLALTCQRCDKAQVVLLSGAPGRCASCGTVFHLVGFRIHDQNITFAEVGFSIAFGKQAIPTQAQMGGES